MRSHPVLLFDEMNEWIFAFTSIYYSTTSHRSKSPKNKIKSSTKMSVRDQNCEHAKATLFNFEDCKLDIADLFMWLFPLWIWIWMRWNQLKKKSNFNWPDSMIERRRLYESRRPICIVIMQTGKNSGVFFWKISIFFQDTIEKFCLIALDLGVQNKGNTHRGEKSNELNRKFSWVFTNYPWKWRGNALWDSSIRISVNIVFWEEMSKTFVHV